MEVRQVRPEEYEEAGRVTALAYQEFAPPGNDDWKQYLGVIEDVAGRVDRTIVLVAVEGSKILGSATIEMDRTVGEDDERLPPDVAALRMLGVDPAARARGVGHALVQATIDRCRIRGKRELILRTTERMKAAQRLYRSMGFERDEGRDQRYDDGFVLYAYRLPIPELGSDST